MKIKDFPCRSDKACSCSCGTCIPAVHGGHAAPSDVEPKDNATLRERRPNLNSGVLQSAMRRMAAKKRPYPTYGSSSLPPPKVDKP